jgi:hypothetical protein
MNKSAELDSFTKALPYVALTAGGIGALGRVGKGILDVVRRDDPEAGPVAMPEMETSVSKTRLEVTPEEAVELRKKGIKVKKIVKRSALNVGHPTNVALGAAGAAALLGAWHGTDVLIDKIRKSKAKKDLEDTKKKIERVLNDTPDSEDEQALHGMMKAAEDIYFAPAIAKLAEVKEAAGIETVWNDASGANNPILRGLGMGIGGAAVLAAVAAYRNSTANSRHLAKAKGLKNLLKNKATETPTASIEPVVVEERSGSPADQAEANAVKVG